jgi:hypothetical protein
LSRFLYGPGHERLPGTQEAEEARRAHEAALGGIQELSQDWLRRLCLASGADDAGFVELGRPELGEENDHPRRLFPAIERAESEAREYATSITDSPDTYLSLAQAYRQPDVPGDGAEVFSLVRVSKLKPTAYIDRFFDTGKEREQQS